MSDNQKTGEELQADVELLVERRSLKAEYDKLESLPVEKARIEKQTATAAKVLEKAEREHERKTAPLSAQLNEIKQALLREQELKDRLWDTCPYEEFRNQLDEVVRRTNSLSTQRAKVANELNDNVTGAESDRDSAKHASTDSLADKYRQRAKDREDKAHFLRRDLEELDAGLAELERYETRIRGKMLEP